MFAPVTKWAAQIDDPQRIPELVGRAFHMATSGRPGPVVLALPQDMQREVVDVVDPLPYHRVKAAPAADDMHYLRSALERVERPLMIVGREGWSSEGIADLRVFAAANELPSISTGRAQDIMDNASPLYGGSLGVGVNPELSGRVREADFLLVVGSRLEGPSTARYTLLDIPRPRPLMAHVYPDPAELGRVYQADVLINATMPEFAAAARAMEPVRGARWAAWREQLRSSYQAHREPVASPGDVNLSEIVRYLGERLPSNAVIANGAGNYTAWVHRFFSFSEPRTQLAPIGGSMGYSVPAAITAKLRYPERIVVSFSGDGCFLMNGQELATAAQYRLPIVFIVVNNGMYGTIRMRQEREFPGRVHGTSLVNPDFADYARAFGAQGEVVSRTEEFAGAFERALEATRPALIELRVDPEAILPGQRLSELSAQTRATTR
jgi:acetolactate synthase-1/2/3 large subunit